MGEREREFGYNYRLLKLSVETRGVCVCGACVRACVPACVRACVRACVCVCVCVC